MAKRYKAWSYATIFVLILTITINGVTPAHAGIENNSPSAGGDGFLNPDGTLKLDGSISGSLNLQGWDVRIDDERGPIFSPTSSGSFSPLDSPAIGEWFGLGHDPFQANNEAVIRGAVRAIAVSGTDVYVGGDFYTAGGNVRADYIAKWDGVTWSNLGDDGLTPSWRSTSAIRGPVYAIAVSGNNVYIGTGGSAVYINGSVAPQAGYIAKWDGTSWSGVGGNGAGGSSLNGSVRTIVASGNDLYVGGSFTNVRNGLTTLNNADYIAKWDGTNWSALGNNGAGDGSLTDQVYTIAVNGSDIYAGGLFTDVKNGSTTLTDADYIARWDGTNWSALGNNGSSPVNGSISIGPVYDIAVSGNDVYAGGDFKNVNNFGTILDAADYIAKWDGENWSALGSNGNGGGALASYVMAVEVVGSDVYAGGNFLNVNNNGNILTAADYVAKWDGTNWSALGGNGANPPNGSLNTSAGVVGSFASTGNDLYVGGMFINPSNNGTVLTNADNVAAYHISDPVYSIYRVAPNGSSSPSCGGDWANPCDLQYALNTLAVSGDEIWVKAGTYKPGIYRGSTFVIQKEIRIYGGFSGTETLLEQRNPTVNVTILSGDLNGNDNENIDAFEPTRAENAYHVVGTGGVGRGAILDGFTISGGNANFYEYPYDPYDFDSMGGGLLNLGSNPVLRNLIFTKNTSVRIGGGMMNNMNGNAFLENVIFNNNKSFSGGGLGNFSSAPTLVNVVFENNLASEDGGGVTNDVGSDPAFYYVTFTNNSANKGGGMFNDNSDPVTIFGSTFYSNHAEKGTGIFNSNSNPIIENSTFTRNSALYGGSAVWNENNSSGVLAYSTISGNQDGVRNLSSGPLITNSIFWGNYYYYGNDPVNITNDATSNPYVTDNVIENGYVGGTNTITDNPLLGPLGYYGGNTLTIPIHSGSSAIDRGYSGYCSGVDQRGVARPQGAKCDIGAYEADGTPIPNIVMNTNDSGPGSLRQAIVDAVPGETITFDPSLAGQTITLASNLVINKDLTIDGSGLYPQVTISGGNVAHIQIANTATTTTFQISDLTIINGYSSGSGGAIESSGNVSIINSTLRNNYSVGSGGAIYSAGALTLKNSTLTQNQAQGSGGAILITGVDATLIVNSTVTNNHAKSGGGITIGGLGTVQILNSTFGANSASAGLAEINYLSNSVYTKFANSVFVCTTQSTNCYFPLTLWENINSILGIGSFTDYGLADLADNGGPTKTMALLPGSPLIDAGDNTTCANAPVNSLDQRGVTRPQGSHCDIGAYEFNPRIIHVKRNAAGLNNGTSWANAYTDLQSALSAALAGDQIWVAAGTYKPTAGTDRAISFVLKNGVAVYGGFAGTENIRTERDHQANVTILSGDIGAAGNNNDNSYHVVITSGTGNSAVLDGFTITKGNANSDVSSSGAGSGGGIYNNLGSPSLKNLIVSENSAYFGGGGMYNSGESQYKSISPILTNIVFSNNSAMGGGGIRNENHSNPILTDVRFDNNTASRGGGGMENLDGSSPILTNVTFHHNTALAGGGMVNGSTSTTLTNVSFIDNSAYWEGYVEGVLIKFGDGGGIYNAQGSPKLTNVTFSGNSAYAHGGGIYNESNSSPVIQNTIFWGNTALLGAQIYDDAIFSTVRDSVVQGGYPNGTNIITSDPLLAPAADNGGFTKTMALLSGSSAIDAGNDAFCPATDQRGMTRPQGSHCDIGAFEALQTTRSIPLLQGWNLVSFNVHPTNTSVSSVLSSIAGSYDLIYAWDASGAHAGSGNWLRADNLPESPDSLTSLNETMGFWIRMTTADTLAVTGTIPQSTNISLLDNAGGWNLVGYPSNEAGNLPNVLSDHGVGTDFSMLYAYHPEYPSDVWKIYDTSVPPYINDLTQLAPGFGYWIKVNADHTWVVNYGAP